jgi:hypothetical protein
MNANLKRYSCPLYTYIKVDIIGGFPTCSNSPAETLASLASTAVAFGDSQKLQVVLRNFAEAGPIMKKLIKLEA